MDSPFGSFVPVSKSFMKNQSLLLGRLREKTLFKTKYVFVDSFYVLDCRYRISSHTTVNFLARKYRLVYCLDISSSVASVVSILACSLIYKFAYFCDVILCCTAIIHWYTIPCGFCFHTNTGRSSWTGHVRRDL